MQISIYNLYSSHVVLIFSELNISIDMPLLLLYLPLLSLLLIYFNLALKRVQSEKALKLINPNAQKKKQKITEKSNNITRYK